MFNQKVRQMSKDIVKSKPDICDEANSLIPALQLKLSEPHLIAIALSSQLRVTVEEAAAIFYAWNLYTF